MTHSSVDLLWLPLGAGARTPVVRWSGRAYERALALREGRRPLSLFHAALEVAVDGEPYTVEMAPRWAATAPERGVELRGPVGSRLLGRSRFFQYEVRSWHNGVIPDRSYAVASPVRLSEDAARAEALVESVARCPAATWGRDEARAGEMWNSNSIVAWLLCVSGHDATGIRPPTGGRAPGWEAGVLRATTG